MTTENNSKKTKQLQENPAKQNPRKEPRSPEKQNQGSEGESPPSTSYGAIESTAKVIGQREGAKKFLNKLMGDPEKLDTVMEKFADLDLEKVMDRLSDGKPSVEMRVLAEDIVLLGEALLDVDNRLARVEKIIKAEMDGTGWVDEDGQKSEENTERDNDEINPSME